MSKQNEFIDLFDYEIQNRAMAFGAMQTMVAKRNLAPEVLSWYQAYLALEHLTQARYAPVAAKYGIATAAKTQATLTILAARIAYYLLPELTILKQALKQTVPYVDQLKRLRELAPEDDHAFFDFVVEQEELQVEALKLRLDHKPEQATKVFEDFVEAHQTSVGAPTQSAPC